MAADDVEVATILSLIDAEKPTFQDAFDAAACVFHCFMKNEGYFAKEEEKREASSDVYTFQYFLSREDKKAHKNPLQVKAVRMVRSLIIHIVQSEDKVHTVTLNVDDFIKKDCKSFGTNYTAWFSNLRQLLRVLHAMVNSKLPRPRTAATLPTRQPLQLPPPRPPVPVPYPHPLHGDRDLDPLANPFGPGNLVGPQHPMFTGRGGRGRGAGLPQPRFDPFGPFGGGEPDFDHLPPPGRRGPFGGGGGGFGFI